MKKEPLRECRKEACRIAPCSVRRKNSWKFFALRSFLGNVRIVLTGWKDSHFLTLINSTMLKTIKAMLLLILMPAILLSVALVGYFAIKEPLPEPDEPLHEELDDTVWGGTLNNN